ncbi:MAG: universal stress protein [Dehalococcoidia bacterium]
MRPIGDVSNFMSSDAAAERLRVLVPLDGSADAERALTVLSALALYGDVRAHLVSVVDDREFSTQLEVLEDEKRLRRLYLEQRISALPDGITAAEPSVLRGHPVARILDEAERIDADLIIVASRKIAGAVRWHRGSVVDKVARDTNRNVLVLGQGQTPAAINAILLPLDGSTRAETAAPVASNFANLLGAALHVVRVVTPPLEALDPGRYDEDAARVTTEMTAALTYFADRYIAQKREELSPAEAKVLVGTPAESLLDYVNANGIDLVVMTPHGRTGPVPAVLGSVTDRMLEGPAPVLIVRAPEADQS